MNREEKNIHNKQWQEFEQLAIDCVRDVYCRQEMQLIPTRLVKDNGYDAKILSDAFRDDKILSWMFCCKDISLFRHRDMSIYFRDCDRTMSKYFLNIPDINVCFQ